MKTLTRRTVQSSELSRNSKAVFAEAEKGPLTVTRRDGQNLVLMTEQEAEERRQMFEFAANILAATTQGEGSLADRMADLFPWMMALSPGGREDCARSLVDTARAAFATHQPHILLVEANSWYETSVARAAGLGEDPIDWLENPEAVERP